MATKKTITKNTKGQTPAEAYARRREDIARLVDVLDQELGKYDEKAKADPANWGYPGTLDYCRTCLIDLIEGVSGINRDDIEAFLAEAE